MSSPPPTRSAAASDPMRAFRERAAVILAEERGFTPQCRMKLARTAGELGLSDAQAEEAIRTLKKEARPHDADPIVEKFRQRLRKDLSGRHRTVIGPEIEARVVESAQRKYGLDAQTVHQVLAEVAAELGLRHITGDQAVQLFADVVDQAVGDSTWLAREAWVRLRTAGEKWGLSFEEADELVEQKIASNRRTAAARTLWNRLAVGGALVLIAAAGATIGGLYFANRGAPGSAAHNAGAGPAEKVPAPPATRSSAAQPPWWDVELAVAIATARREVSDVADLYDALRSEDGGARRAAYETLADLVLKIDPQEVEWTVVVNILAGCHALDPDESCAARVRELLCGAAPGRDQRLSRSTVPYQRAYQGVDAALAMLAQRKKPEPRSRALAAALSSAAGTSLSIDDAPAQVRRDAMGALTKVLYRHLSDRGPSQPEDAAELHPFLAAQAAQWLTAADIERLNVAFLTSMLGGAEKSWKSFEPLMTGLAESRDPLIVLELLGSYRKAENPALQRALGGLLVRRTGARPRSDDPRQVARAVRQALGAAGVSVAQSAEERWDDLKAAVEPVLARASAPPTDRAAVWSETVELAGLATQALALAQGEPGFAIFDEISQPPEKGSEGSSAVSSPGSRPSGASFRAPEVKRRPPTLQEKQYLARTVVQLADFENQSPVVRTNALRIVASRVPTAADLTYDQATIVARYLLARKEEGELDSIGDALSALRAWKQVRLALADRLNESKLTASQLEELLSRLTGSDAVPSGATTAALHRWLLASVLAETEDASEPDPPSAPDGAQFGEPLAEAYRQRARALAVPAAEYQAVRSPAAALEMVVGVFARRAEGGRAAAPAGSGASRIHQLAAARYLAQDEPQRAVLMQRLLLETMAQQIATRKPAQAVAAAKIVGDLAAADAAAGDLLVQLRGGERATLEMGMLYGSP